MSAIEDWFKALPPFTRYYLVASLSITTLVSFGILNAWYLYLDLELVLRNLHVWRVLTTFLFFGKFSMPFLMSLVILVHFGRLLETHSSFQANYADFVWCISFLCFTLLMASLLVDLLWLGSSLLFAMLYVWSKKDPDVVVNFWFGFQFKAFQFPFVLIVFRVMLGDSVLDDIAGLLAGHLYFYLKEVVPRDYGYKLLETPQFIKKYFNVIPNLQRAQTNFTGRGYRLG